MTYKNYHIIIQVINNETDEIVGNRITSDTEIAEQCLTDVPKWINNYEKENQVNK